MLLVPLFKKLGLGSVLGYLFAGVVIGPSVIGVVHEPETILHRRALASRLLMFIIGLSCSVSGCGRYGARFSASARCTCWCAGAALAALAWWANLRPGGRPHIGIARLAMTSTAFASPALAERGEMDSPHGRETFSVLLFQDLSVIPVLALVGVSVPPRRWRRAQTQANWLASTGGGGRRGAARGAPAVADVQFALKCGSHEIFHRRRAAHHHRPRMADDHGGPVVHARRLPRRRAAG